MKAKPAILLFMAITMLLAKANADNNIEKNQGQDQSHEQVSSDFLEFLADMTEVTGDGFENWLEAEDKYNDGSDFDKRSTEDPLQ